MTDRLLKGRIALITGASRGIGAATALLFAQHGAAVAVNYHSNEAAAQAVVAQITALGGTAIPIQADAGNADQVAAMVEQTTKTLGPIDTLVLNATSVPRFLIQPFVQFTWDDFQAMVTGEISAAFHACKAVIPGMIERKQGCIIGISSGLSRTPIEGMSAHSTGKSGLDAFMKTLAVELGPSGIRVNTVAPGMTQTDASADYAQQSGRNEWVIRLTPLRRIGTAQDIAGAILMLASPHAGFVTGAYVPVSGGIQLT
jgi:3-oxoacyl-[acyl-carrier protein] reductase